MKVLIVGDGRALYFLCRSYAAKGYDVVVLNRDQQECVHLARQLSATVICGDGSDLRTLAQAGAMDMDAVLAVTAEDQDNLVICQLATLQFGVPHAVALANDPDNAEVFEKLGVSAFSTIGIVSSFLEQRTSLEQIRNLIPVGEGRVIMTEIALDTESPVADLFLKDIELPENALVAVVLRDNIPIIPRGGNKLLAGDKVVLITVPENHGQVLNVFTGEPA